MDKYGKALLERTVDIRDITGKKVYSLDGMEIGKVKSIRVDPLTLNTDVLVLDTGIINGDLLIGRNYVEKMDKDVRLNIIPWEAMQGKEVFDSRGEMVGKIREVKRIGTTSKVGSIVIQKPKKIIEVDGKHVNHIGEHVDLRIDIEA